MASKEQTREADRVLAASWGCATVDSPLLVQDPYRPQRQYHRDLRKLTVIGSKQSNRLGGFGFRLYLRQIEISLHNMQQICASLGDVCHFDPHVMFHDRGRGSHERGFFPQYRNQESSHAILYQRLLSGLTSTNVNKFSSHMTSHIISYIWMLSQLHPNI